MTKIFNTGFICWFLVAMIIMSPGVRQSATEFGVWAYHTIQNRVQQARDPQPVIVVTPTP